MPQRNMVMGRNLSGPMYLLIILKGNSVTMKPTVKRVWAKLMSELSMLMSVRSVSVRALPMLVRSNWRKQKQRTIKGKMKKSTLSRKLKLGGSTKAAYVSSLFCFPS